MDEVSFGASQGRRAQEAIRRFHELCTSTGGIVNACRTSTGACGEYSCGRGGVSDGGGFLASLYCACPEGAGWDLLEGCRSCSLPYTCADVEERVRAIRACTADSDCWRGGMSLGICECSIVLMTAGPRSVESRYSDMEILARIDAELGCGLHVCRCSRPYCEDGQCVDHSYD